MAVMPPLVQEFRADTRQFTRTVTAMARHLGALVDELAQIEREEQAPPPEPAAATVQRVARTLTALSDELLEAAGGVVAAGISEPDVRNYGLRERNT